MFLAELFERFRFWSQADRIGPDIPTTPWRLYILKKGCWLGANVIVLPGVTIGENSVVGAGSLVTKSIPARGLAAGNSARIIRNIEESE